MTDSEEDDGLEARLKEISNNLRVKVGADLQFACPVSSCRMMYRSAFGVRYHLRRQHVDVIDRMRAGESVFGESLQAVKEVPKRKEAGKPSVKPERRASQAKDAEETDEKDTDAANASAVDDQKKKKKLKADDANCSEATSSESLGSDSEGDSEDDDAEEDETEQNEDNPNERVQQRARARAYYRKRFAILQNRRRKRRKKLLTIASERSNSKLVQLKRSGARIGANGGPLNDTDIFALADSLINVDESTQTVTVAFAPGAKYFSFKVFEELPVTLAENEVPAAEKRVSTSQDTVAKANSITATPTKVAPDAGQMRDPSAAAAVEGAAPEAPAVDPSLTRTPPPVAKPEDSDADRNREGTSTAEREPSSTASSPRRRIRPLLLSPVPPPAPKQEPPPPPPLEDDTELSAEARARRAAELRTKSARNAALARWRRYAEANGTQPGGESKSSAGPRNQNPTQTSLPIATAFGTSLPLSFKVPECKYRLIDSDALARRYAKANAEAEAEATAPANVYYRHVERTDEELDETVEYDMDDQDAAWLTLLNQQRASRNPPLSPLSSALFERLLDRFEKDSHFEQLAHPAGDRGEAGGNIEEEEELEEHEAVCCICLDGECENSNAILFCDLCNLPVHQDCYGVPYIPEGQWLCRRCQLSPSRSVDCCLCPLKGGAFKLVADADSDALASASSPTRGASAAALALSPTLGAAGAFPFGLMGIGGADSNASGSARWAHVVCALWIPEVAFANTVFLEPIIDVHRIPASRWRLTCYLCKQRSVGACIQCSKTNCYTAFHVTCAQQAGLCMKIAPIAGTACVKKTAYCDMHTPPSLAFSSMMPADIDSMPTPGSADIDGDSECGKPKTKVKVPGKMQGKKAAAASNSAVSSSASFASANKSNAKADRGEAASGSRLSKSVLRGAANAAANNAAQDGNEAESGSQADSMTAERLERLAQLRRRVLTERRSAQQSTINIPVIAPDKLARLAQRCGLSDTETDALIRRLYAYWQLKRLARCGVALLRRLQVQTRSRPAPAAPDRRRRERDGRSAPTSGSTTATGAISAQATGMGEQVKMWSRLRRDFEKLRLLVEQVRKREKLKREMVRLEQRCALLTVQPFTIFARRLLDQLKSFDTESLFTGDGTQIRTNFKLSVDARSLFACTSVNLRTVAQRLDAAEYTTLDQLHGDVTKMVVNHRRLDGSSRFQSYVDRFGKQAEALLAEARKTALANGGYDPQTGLHCELALLQAPSRRSHSSPCSTPVIAGRPSLHAIGGPRSPLQRPLPVAADPLQLANRDTNAVKVASRTPSGSHEARPAISFSAYRNTEAIPDSDEEDGGRAGAGNSASLRSSPKRARISPVRVDDDRSDSESTNEGEAEAEAEAETVQPVKRSPLRSGHALFEAVRLQPAVVQPQSPLLSPAGHFTLPKATKLERSSDTDSNATHAKTSETNEQPSASPDTLAKHADESVKQPISETEEAVMNKESEAPVDTASAVSESPRMDVALRVETTLPSSCASVSVSGSGNLSTHTLQSRDSDFDGERTVGDRDMDPMDDADSHTRASTSRKRKRSSASTCDSHLQPAALQRFDFVWAKVSGHPFFPAIVIHGTHISDELKISPDGWITYRSARFPAPPNDILELAAQFESAGSSSSTATVEAHYLVLFFDSKQTWTWVTRSKLAPLGDPRTDQDVMIKAKNKKATVKKAYERACSDLLKIRMFEQRQLNSTESANSSVAD